MRRVGILAGLVLIGGVTAASAQRSTRDVAIHDAAGKEVGRATVRDSLGTMLFHFAVNGLPQGTHGVHLHEAAKCEGPGFESAGPHYNPHLKEHGRQNPKGPHLGDLGNIVVDAGGKGTRNVGVTGPETRRGMDSFLETGRSIVIHANADDEKTDPSGNSGARIACAVLK
jgi:Cu-Zn family superoxide dismutase